jgi:exosortase
MHKQSVNKQNIKVVILVGSRDFGRCPIASRIPLAFWPIAGKSALERLLDHLTNQRINQVVICSNGDGSLLEKSIHTNHLLDVKFLNEQLPVGTAGCIRDAAGNEQDTLLLVFPANIVNPPKIDMLIQAHREGRADLTVMFNPNNGNGNSFDEAAGIYVCETSILEHIPEEGYFDIKEGLIPKMIRSGKTIHTATLPNYVGNFRNWQEYLFAIASYLQTTPKLDAGLKLSRRNDSQALWTAANVKIDPNAKIYGPVVIMEGAEVLKDAIIFGPTILGRDVIIGEGTIVVNSMLWDGVKVGLNCEIQRCVIDYRATVRGNTVVEEKAVPFKSKGMLESAVSNALKVTGDNTSRLWHALQPQFDKLNGKLPCWLKSHKVNIVPWFAAGLVLIAFLWSYRPTIWDLWGIWQRSDEYSSGLLVPFLAVYILWSRRNDIAQCRIRPSPWGLFAFVAAQGMRLFGLFFMYGSAERLSIALSIAALVLLLFGWQLFRKVSTVLLFLCLMLPWPNRVQAALALPLQNWATSSAVFCLEMIGYEVVREGNVIHIGQASVAVAEACNGLRMITAFFVISGLVILLVKREWWEKLLILASGLPIALLCNTVRLTITAIAFTVLRGEYWEKIFHDFGGYAMMPLALGMIVLELWLLTKITTIPPEKQVVLASK